MATTTDQKELLLNYLKQCVYRCVEEDLLLKGFSAVAIVHAEKNKWITQTKPGVFTINV